MSEIKAEANTPEEAPARPEGAKTKRVKKEKGEKSKKEKRVRAKYPVPDGGLTEWPTDFDAKKHKPLARTAFKDETLWLTKKAEMHERAGKKLREEIEEIKTLGPGATRAKAKKLEKMKDELDVLTQALKDSGMNVEELLAKAKAKKDAERAEEAATAPAA